MHSDKAAWTQQTSTGLYPTLKPVVEEEKLSHNADVQSSSSSEGEVLVARAASWLPKPSADTAVADPKYHVTLFHSSVGVDKVEKCTTYVFMIIEFFKLLMACLLALFVPQMCYANSDYANDQRKAEGDGECSFVELFLSASPYNIFVLVWNFCTLVVCLAHRSLTSQREAFMVDHFDVNRSLPPDNIKTVLLTNPHVGAILTDWNKRIFTSAFLFMSFNVLNFIFSGVLVWSRIANYRTSTVFLTNVLLLAQLIFWDLSVARRSWKAQEALSLVNKDNRRYNELDHRRKADSGVCELTGLRTMASL